MSHYIKNYTALATTSLRTDALSIVEAGYAAINTTDAINRSCVLQGTQLSLQGHIYDLSAYEHIYLIGFGKASCDAIAALETILTTSISEGVVIDKHPGICQIAKVYQGGHPLSTLANVAIAEQVVTLAQKATERDLVIVVVSGGGSALLCWPTSEYEQSRLLYQRFLRTGGTIEELNILRKHISRVKGGGLAQLLYPATVAALIFSDIPGNRYDLVASGPTYKDETTIADAQAILETYGISDAIVFNETPKEDMYFERVTNIPLVSNLHAVEGMRLQAEALGYQVQVCSTTEYREVSEVLADMSHSARQHEKIAVLTAGEPSMKITRTGDASGRSEYAGIHALSIIGSNEVCIPFASDGIDNGSRAAGVVVDTLVIDTMKEQKEDLATLHETGAYDAFWHRMQTQIITGPTGSNVSDCIVYLRNTL